MREIKYVKILNIYIIFLHFLMTLYINNIMPLLSKINKTKKKYKHNKHKNKHANKYTLKLKTNKNKTKYSVIGSGIVGCAFKPHLPCDKIIYTNKQIQHSELNIDKITKIVKDKTHLNDELNSYKSLLKLDPKSLWHLPLYNICKINPQIFNTYSINYNNCHSNVIKIIRKSIKNNISLYGLTYKYGGESIMQIFIDGFFNNMTPKQKYNMFSSFEHYFLSLSNLYKLNYAHSDLHIGNCVYNNKENKTYLIDYGSIHTIHYYLTKIKTKGKQFKHFKYLLVASKYMSVSKNKLNIDNIINYLTKPSKNAKKSVIDILKKDRYYISNELMCGNSFTSLYFSDDVLRENIQYLYDLKNNMLDDERNIDEILIQYNINFRVFTNLIIILNIFTGSIPYYIELFDLTNQIKKLKKTDPSKIKTEFAYKMTLLKHKRKVFITYDNFIKTKDERNNIDEFTQFFMINTNRLIDYIICPYIEYMVTPDKYHDLFVSYLKAMKTYKK